MQVFETEGLIGTGAAAAVLSYLFHRIEGRLDGRPTLLIVDEGWLALDDGGFAGQLREWLKTLRKKNASVVFATQSLSDIETSAIAPAIIESCPTRIFLPNDRAIEPQILSIYRRFGLNDRQIEIVSRATPKRDYYCQSRRGNRLFELGLGPVALALTAASSKSDQAAIERVLAEHGRDGFLAAWLAERGVAWAADLIPNLNLALNPLALFRRSPRDAVSQVSHCRHLRPGACRQNPAGRRAHRLRSLELCGERAHRRAFAGADPEPDHQPPERGADADQPGEAAHLAADLGACQTFRAISRRSRGCCRKRSSSPTTSSRSISSSRRVSGRRMPSLTDQQLFAGRA